MPFCVSSQCLNSSGGRPNWKGAEIEHQIHNLIHSDGKYLGITRIAPGIDNLWRSAAERWGRNQDGRVYRLFVHVYSGSASQDGMS